MDFQFLVRTYCPTYNHDSYIKDALRGFVIQETSFPVVYTIVDDASTDCNAEVIREFVNENFELKNTLIAYEKDTDYGHVTFAQHKTNKNCYFAVVYLKENHYSQKKPKKPYLTEWMDTKYVAECEGDDYWTDPLKLQKQVDYLESHSDCCMCCHAAEWEVEGRLEHWGCRHKEDCDLNTEEVIKEGGFYLATASLVYRSILGDDKPEWRKMANVGDYPLQILGTLRGKLHFFSETMCVYRFQHSDSWSIKLKEKDWKLKYLNDKSKWMEMLDEDTKYAYTAAIHAKINKDRYKLYQELFCNRQISFFKYLCSVRDYDKDGRGKYERALKDLLFVRFNWFYRMIKRN